ncbi:hypothetical protein ADU78_05810 [Clostridium botulinum]|uniref:hypothetical protein n=1 Tax=Clostridium botulinum TaxID=1491 RepID=UPI00069BB35E|nr:hypothetical protein [Clostridium botulinum]KOA76600.1 hypothetical protein ADU78_05810 [Clostridium botulinum]KOC47760.1 hypothetical protein ADU86_03965 [Clostridium botulinum]
MLEELKEYLREDDNEDILKKLLKTGQDYLNKLAGITLDYESNILAKTLLLDYCRYRYNNATEYFFVNFREDILRLQLESAVMWSAKQKTSDATTSAN